MPRKLWKLPNVLIGIFVLIGMQACGSTCRNNPPPVIQQPPLAGNGAPPKEFIGPNFPLLEHPETREIDVLFVSPEKEGVPQRGGVLRLEITIAKNLSKKPALAIREIQVRNTSTYFAASMWIAAYVAAFNVAHSPCDYFITVGISEVSKPIDGTSAGASAAAAMMAAMTGVPIRGDVAITGAINPDGSIGNVDGIILKMQGAAAKGKKLFGYPVGQRYALDPYRNRRVDVHEFAKEKGMEARPLNDIHDAFELLTDKQLRPPPPLKAREMTADFEHLRQTTDSWIAQLKERFNKDRSYFVPLLNDPGSKAVVDSMYAIMKNTESYLWQDNIPVAIDSARESAEQIAAYTDLAKHTVLWHHAAEHQKLISDIEGRATLDVQIKAFFNSLSSTEVTDVASAVSFTYASSQAIESWALNQMTGSQWPDIKRLLASTDEATLASETVQKKYFDQLRGPLFADARARAFLDSAHVTLKLIDRSHQSAHQPVSTVQIDPMAVNSLAQVYISATYAILESFQGSQLSWLLGKEGLSTPWQRDYGVTLGKLRYARENLEKQDLHSALTSLSAALGAFIYSAGLLTLSSSLHLEFKDRELTEHMLNETLFMAMIERAHQKALEAAWQAREVVSFVPAAPASVLQVAQTRREVSNSLADKILALQLMWTSTALSQVAVLLQRTAIVPVKVAQPSP